MKGKKKRLYKKYEFGAALTAGLGYADKLDIASPLLKKNLDQDYLGYSTEMNNQEQTDLGRQNIQKEAEPRLNLKLLYFVKQKTLCVKKNEYFVYAHFTK